MRLKTMMAACAAASALLLPPSASAYEQQIGNSKWSFYVWEDVDGGFSAYVNDYWQVDEKGDWVVPQADFALEIPASFTVSWTNEYVKVAERVYDEDGDFLSNKYVTVRGPEIKSVTATVTSVYVDNYLDWDYEEVYDPETGDYLYTKEVLIYNYLGHLTSLAVPATVNYVSGFYDCTNLTTVSMAEDTWWGGNTFSGSPYRKNLGEFVIHDGTLVAYQGEAAAVTVPDGVKEIGDGAFSLYYGNASTNLTSVTLPASVKMIGSYAFYGCGKLASINLPEGVSYIDSGAFENCHSLNAVAIPSRVKSIGSYAFAWSGVGSIVIPEGVKNLYGSTFSGCTNLTSVTLPTSLTRIDDSAFYRCSALASIAIPSSVESIGDSAFYDCTNLTSVTLPASLTHIGYSAFNGCGKLASIALPASLTSIGSYAFSYCTALTSVTIPDSVQSIGSEAFYWCTNLATVAGGAGVTYVSYDVFDGTALERKWWEAGGLQQAGTMVLGYSGTLPAKLSIPAGVTFIRDNAFSYNYDIEELELPASVHTIGYNAFGSCYNLATVTGGAGLRSGSDAFWNTQYANTFWGYKGDDSVPFEYVRLGGVIFGYKGVCPATVTIPDDVVQVSDNLFSYWYDWSVTNITSAVIGAKLGTVRSSMFRYAENLSSVTFGASLTNIEDCAFYGCQGLTALAIPATVERIEDSAFAYCTNLTSVTGGGAIHSIYWGAFDDCPNLTDVSLAGPLTDIGSLFGGDGSTTTNIVNVTFTQTEAEADEEDEDPHFESFYLRTFCFDRLDKLASVNVQRKGYELVKWTASVNGPAREEFDDVLDTFKLGHKGWGYVEEYNPDTESWEYKLRSTVSPLYLHAEWKRVLRNVETDGPFNMDERTVYLGWLTDASGNIVGSITVTTSKGRNGVSNTKAAVQLLGERKINLKGTVNADGTGTGELAGLVLGASGLSGTIAVNGAVYTADGARDVNKTKNDASQSGLNALKDKVWTMVLEPRANDNPYAKGYLGFSVTMGAKGKAKFKGVLPSGARVMGNTQTIVGETGYCIPVISSKKDSIGFLFWLDLAGNAKEITSISAWKSTTVKDAPFTVPVEVVTFDSLNPLSGTVPFRVWREDVPATLTGVLVDFLPEYEPVSINGSKWDVAKPANIKYTKGAFDQAAYDKGVAQGKTNVSALKLRYTPKDGAFKGSFKIYTLNDGKLKKINVSVDGVVSDGMGYGVALIKKFGAMPVAVGEED